MKAIHNLERLNPEKPPVVVNIIKSKNESNSQPGYEMFSLGSGCCKYH
ncbi:hypothetical protein HMPREF0766_11444 [Sphingobacterium spiritivorum ATCC 33861]|uniref:Uncharacterized protein n=1 Tax=Sphingobacterium spiritivorum ATCC 33861 TaxID=525373 RepID=D7VKC5_SPHSI|nr:hypothetical protein HMPREF0766_11444 [Sphingobacterium spiritivorum ATCC 33861]